MLNLIKFLNSINSPSEPLETGNLSSILPAIALILCIIIVSAITYFIKKHKNKNNSAKRFKLPILESITQDNGQLKEKHVGNIEILDMYLHGYKPTDCFIFRVKGNSMSPDFIEGDLVAIHRQSSVESDTTAVVLYNDEAFLKKVNYKQGEEWLEIISINSEYQTKHLEDNALKECLIIGKVLSLVYRNLNNLIDIKEN